VALQKAKLYNADTGAEVVQFHFNPNEFTVNQANQWQPQQTSGSSIPDVRFGGVGARTLSMTIVFDTYEQKSDVRTHTDKVQRLMEVPPAQSPTGKQSRPPHVEFGWGTFRSFRAVITQVSQRFTLFLPDGTPVRATLQLTLQEVPRESAERRLGGRILRLSRLGRGGSGWFVLATPSTTLPPRSLVIRTPGGSSPRPTESTIRGGCALA
jgi:hypothetical protein